MTYIRPSNTKEEFIAFRDKISNIEVVEGSMEDKCKNLFLYWANIAIDNPKKIQHMNFPINTNDIYWAASNFYVKKYRTPLADGLIASDVGLWARLNNLYFDEPNYITGK